MHLFTSARSWLSRRRTLNTLRGLSNETLDDIGLTLERTPAIESFEKSYSESRPWA